MGVLGGIDIFVIVASLCAVFALSLSAIFRKKSELDAASEYFLAGRRSEWWLIAASLVASNIGTEHFVGQAGAAAYSGAVLALCEWLAAYLLLSLGWLFAPVYLRVKLTTIPQLLEERFNKYCRGLYVGILLVLYILSKIGTSIYAGAVLLDVILGWSMWKSVPLIIISTTLYTMGGGLKAVMLTDALQFTIFLTGGLAGTITSLHLVGGISGLFHKLESVGLTEAPHLFQSLDDRDYPWLGMLLGVPVSSIAYWCVDQEMAQRVLAGKNLSEVRLGTSTAGLLKLIPPFITVFPGMVARALYELCKQDPDSSEFPEWCSADMDDSKSSDRAYPLLIVNNFPSGIKVNHFITFHHLSASAVQGLMTASFLAAMMSSISSVFNSAATVFTYDIYERMFGPPGGSSPEKLTLVGRVLVCVMAVLALCYLPVIQKLDRGLYILGYIALAHFAPPISALFVGGIFTRRTTGEGAIAGFATGSLLGLIRFVCHILYQDQCDEQCVEGKQKLMASNWFFCLNFNYFGFVLFFVTLTIMIGVSHLYPPPNRQIKEDYTFWLKDLTCTAGNSTQPSTSPEDEPLLIETATELKEDQLQEKILTKYISAVIISLMTVIAVTCCLVIFH